MKVLSFLSSNPNTPSAMRVMSTLSLLIGAGIAFYGLYQKVDPEKLAWLVGVFVTSAFGGKAMQKKYEKANKGLATDSTIKSEPLDTEK